MRDQVLPPNVRLIGLEFAAPLELYAIASFVFGLAITFSVFACEIYRFIDPALHPNERKAVYPFVASVSVLFVIGVLFGYKVLTPYIIWAMFPFFSAVGAVLIISIMDFYTTLFITTLVTGLVFTFPVFLVLIVKHGIVGTDILTKNRKYLYAALFIITLIITPDGGQIGNFVLFIPMVLLMEIGIFFAKRYEKKQKVHPKSWLPNESNCKFCGSTISTGTIFCSKCGRSQK